MKFLIFSFIMNGARHKFAKHNDMKPSMLSKLTKESFVGSWIVNENHNKRIVHFKPQGVIHKSSNKKSDYVGYWDIDEDNVNFNLRDNNREKKYYGKIFNNTLNISGNVCEGLLFPYFIHNFTMTPVSQQFHNISFVNVTERYTYLNQNNVTGRWLLENTHTNKLYLLELHSNNTWNSINLYYTNSKLSGKWNLFNETNEINTNYAIKFVGKNIWLNINKQRNQSYVTYDIIFLGKIVQLGSMYYINEDKPSSYNEEKVIISSKINGSVVYGFDMEPEVSETFYMKRWFDH